jgi:hypothetical protein
MKTKKATRESDLLSKLINNSVVLVVYQFHLKNQELSRKNDKRSIKTSKEDQN